MQDLQWCSGEAMLYQKIAALERSRGYGFPCRFMVVGRGSVFAAGCQDIGIAAATASSLCERK